MDTTQIVVMTQQHGGDIAGLVCSVVLLGLLWWRW
jgi:hypothetical protein